jgi:hypothetical protein
MPSDKQGHWFYAGQWMNFDVVAAAAAAVAAAVVVAAAAVVMTFQQR